MMRTYFKILLPIFFMAVCYAVLAFFFGPKGVYAQKALEEQKVILMNHLNDLYETGVQLDEEIANLAHDYDTIKVYANKLGYVSEGEEMIKLLNFNNNMQKQLHPGTELVFSKVKFIPDNVLKTLAFSVGILVALLELIFSFKGFKQNGYSKKFA